MSLRNWAPPTLFSMKKFNVKGCCNKYLVVAMTLIALSVVTVR